MTSVAEAAHARHDGHQAPIGLPLRPMRQHELGELIVSTTKSDIHACNDAEVIKLYKQGVSRAEVEDVAHVSMAVCNAGLAVPAMRPYLVECDRRFGIAFDRAHGPLLLELSYRDPMKIAAIAAILAEQHRLIHAVRGVRGLRAQKTVLAEKLKVSRGLAEGSRTFLQSLLETLPDGTSVCHGDFHYGNIIVCADSPVVIDWVDATVGNHLCDVARSWMLLRFAGNDNWKARLYCRLASSLYERSYVRKSPADKRELASWKLVNMAARLSEYLEPRERARTLAHLEGQLRRVVA